MYNGKWAGTMCLTEPQAGSDVGSVDARRRPAAPTARYDIRGTKIFISGGDQDMSENIIHMVLARIPDAPPGTKGLSLFIVPKLRPDGTSNDVAVAGIEHKMGINARRRRRSSCSATAAAASASSSASAENRGMSQMFHLMNYARIGVGIQGLSIASSAYLNALDYAQRPQAGQLDPAVEGRHRAARADHRAPRREAHAARHEGARRGHPRARREAHDAHRSRPRARRAPRTPTDKERAEYHQGQVDLLVPLLKAYGSDQAFQICATAIQVYGGAGYLQDWPVEQYCRDSKIFSIYEGTNHIQAMDLVGRKLMQRGGANVQAFAQGRRGVRGREQGAPALKDAVAVLGQAMEAPHRDRRQVHGVVRRRPHGDGARDGEPLPRDDVGDRRRLAPARAGRDRRGRGAGAPGRASGPRVLRRQALRGAGTSRSTSCRR